MYLCKQGLLAEAVQASQGEDQGRQPLPETLQQVRTSGSQHLYRSCHSRRVWQAHDTQGEVQIVHRHHRRLQAGLGTHNPGLHRFQGAVQRGRQQPHRQEVVGAGGRGGGADRVRNKVPRAGGATGTHINAGGPSIRAMTKWEPG